MATPAIAQGRLRIHTARDPHSERIRVGIEAKTLASPKAVPLSAFTYVRTYSKAILRQASDVREFFLMHAFLADQEDRVLRHLDDPCFRGVYIMLASALPLEEAKALKYVIVDHAADSKDHHLSDAVVQVLKTRRSVRLEPV